MAADGSIVINVDLDQKEAQRELNRLTKEINKVQESINKLESARSPLIEQAESLRAHMAKAAAEADRYKQAWLSGDMGADKGETVARERVAQLRAEYEGVLVEIEKYDNKIAAANEQINAAKEKAGELAEQLGVAGANSEKMEKATKKASKSMSTFAKRLKGIVASAFVFNLLSAGLRTFTDWIGKAIKSSGQASAAIAKLKGALLTLVQPLVSVVIPAFTTLVNVLTALISKVAQLVAKIFGTTASDAAEAAEALYEEQQAIDGVGSSAKKASQKLAAFDEINTLSSDSSNGASAAGEIAPDFSAATDTSWLDSMLGDVAGKVAAALMLGGIALVAIGAGTGSLATVIAGLTLLNAGISIGEDTGVFTSWAEALGLDSVTQYIAAALMLGGIALVAIGAATGSLTTVLAGLGLLGSGIALAEGSEEMQSWVEKLGLNSVNEFIANALILGGIAIIAIGAMMGNILMVIAGLGLIGGAVVYADEETKASWIETLGLDNVFDYVTVAMQLAGIALIAIGACMGNIVMVVAGGLLLGLGVAADAIGEETLSDWWDVLKLTTVQQWVSVALLLVGIALIAVGACMGNILMILAGAGLLGLGTIIAATDGNLKDWVTVLGLEKVVGWVTAGLLLVGLALVVFGILTANIAMILAGAGLLGAGVAIGVTSGTFSSWLDTILKAFTGFKEKILEVFNGLWGGIKSVVNWIIGGIEWMANKVIDGINFVIKSLNKVSFTMPDWLGGGTFGFNIKPLENVSIPRLATGAVIPPNREFMAVLGDNKTETEVVSPLSTMKQAMIEALREVGGIGSDRPIEVNVILDKQIVGRVMVNQINDMTRAAGKPVLLY